MYYQTLAFDLARDDPQHRVVRTESEFWDAIRWLEKHDAVAVDTETSGTAWYRHSRICGVSMTARDGERLRSFYFPCRHQTGEQQLHPDVVMRGCKMLLHNERIEKRLWNIKFDEHFFLREGIQIRGPRRDIMIDAALWDENSPMALKERVALDLNDTRAHVYEDILDGIITQQARWAGVGKNEYRDRVGYARVPVMTCGIYACYDTEFTWRLAEYYDANQVRQYFASIYETEQKLTRVLCDMEENGLPVNPEYFHWLARTMDEEMNVLKPRLFSELGGYTFNPDSDDEVRTLICKRLGLEGQLWKTTDSGEWSVDKEVLEHFSEDHPAIATLAEYRIASKIRSTYTESILEHVDANNILHGEFRQLGTNTGRMSANRPNLQNFASDSDKRALAYSGKKLEDGGQDPWSVKRGFVNRAPEYIRGYFDYSQIELRVLAYYSRDPVLTDVYLKGEDVHTRTSMEVFGSAEKSFRRNAKIINFGLSYCMSAKGYARQAKVPEAKAEEDMRVFFAKYPRIEPFRKEFWAWCRANGNKFQNMFGRPRRLPNLSSTNAYERGRAERMAIGTLVQGSAAQLTKESLVSIYEWEQKHRSGLKLCSTIHDENTVDIPKRVVREAVPAIVRLMENFPQFAPIPIVTDAQWSDKDWSEKHDFPEGMAHAA